VRADRDLFDRARQAAGSLVLERQVPDLNPLVESTQPAARRRDVTLTVGCAQALCVNRGLPEARTGLVTGRTAVQGFGQVPPLISMRIPKDNFSPQDSDIGERTLESYGEICDDSAS
jgi:hypothetical protein